MSVEDSWAAYESIIQAKNAQLRLEVPVSLSAPDRRAEWERLYDCTFCHRRNTLVAYAEEGVNICANCGSIYDDPFGEQGLLPGVKYKKSRTAPYCRWYHWNERMAAYRCEGPRVPPDVVRKVATYIRDTPVRRISYTGYRRCERSRIRLDVWKMNSHHFRQLFADLNMRTYAERWISLKQDLLGGPRVWQPPYPDFAVSLRVNHRFILLSKAFNAKLYKKGKRRTSLDNSYASTHPLARHNMPHYVRVYFFIILVFTHQCTVCCHFRMKYTIIYLKPKNPELAVFFPMHTPIFHASRPRASARSSRR